MPIITPRRTAKSKAGQAKGSAKDAAGKVESEGKGLVSYPPHEVQLK